ncbi:MAG: peptidoglycan DD-metalloendopeptidase family protein [Casimicrobiaceae bacterium]
MHEALILAQRLHATARRALTFLSRTQWLSVAVLAGSGMAAFGIAPDSALEIPPPEALVIRALVQPEITPLAADSDRGYWREERVQRGDTLGRLLARMGVDDPEALQFVHSDPLARNLYQLRPGKALRLETDADGRLLALRFMASGGQLLSISRDAGSLSASLGPPPAEVRLKMGSGEIRSSLFAAADAADVPDGVTRQLADVFAGDIDFYHDLRRGDRFAVVYEERFVDGEPIGTGKIIAAEFVNAGTTYRAFLWRGADGYEAYYAEDGTALRKTFLRSPMDFSRVTSGFTQARFHPILQEWRAHKGVDYAAPLGTPVRATADGKVLFSGVQNGYGNVVHLKHEGVYSTLYAHLSTFAPGLHPGDRVRQGDVIGFVGQTGWATGPHLHYEFRVNNDQRDPETLAFPRGDALTPEQKPMFVARVAPALAQLSVAASLPDRVASAGGD